MRSVRMAAVGASVCALMAATLPQVSAAETEAGNNLSVPVLWSEAGYPPIFSTTVTDKFEGVVLDGYEVSQDTTSEPCKGAVQKDPNNVWRADTALAEGGSITTVDWGDSIEARDPNLNRAYTRIEMGLYATVTEPMTGYDMCWISGRGMNEVWGAQVKKSMGKWAPITNEGTEAMVYTAGARLTIQRIVPGRTYGWNASLGQWQGSGADAPYFNSAIHEAAASGPGTFGSEVTVSGRLSYGYLWDAKSMPQGEYRLTFSLDGAKGGFPGSGTSMANAIVKPSEEGELIEALEADEVSAMAEGSGNTAVMRGDLNLTYIDVTVGTRTDPIPPEEPVTPPVDGGSSGGGAPAGGDVAPPVGPAPGGEPGAGAGENPGVGPASPTGLIPQQARIRAKKAGTYKVGQRLLLAARPIKTDAGVTVRWRERAQDRLTCTVRVRDGRATVLLKKAGSCTVVGWAPAPSPQFERYQWTRTYRVTAR